MRTPCQAVVLALVRSGMFNSMIFGIGMGDFSVWVLASCWPCTSGRHRPSPTVRSHPMQKID